MAEGRDEIGAGRRFCQAEGRAGLGFFAAGRPQRRTTGVAEPTRGGGPELMGGLATVVVGKSFWTIWVRPWTSLGFMPMPVAWGQAKPWAARMLLHEKETRIS